MKNDLCWTSSFLFRSRIFESCVCSSVLFPVFVDRRDLDLENQRQDTLFDACFVPSDLISSTLQLNRVIIFKIKNISVSAMDSREGAGAV